MFDFYGKTVLVTGGSSGLGAAFAEALAQKGARLVLVARSEARLQALAARLTEAHGATVACLPADLSLLGAAGRLHAAVRALGWHVDVLINNAGIASFGAFSSLTLEAQREEVALNVSALVELTYAFLPEIEARQGGVIQVASTAAFQPVPWMAVYAASKAFVLSFSEALWAEYQGRGVRVLALCPGATDTPFFVRASEQAALGPKASPAAVVQLGLDAFSRGRSSVIHGARNYWTTQLSRLLPREAVLRVTRRLMRPRQAPALLESR